MMSQRPTQILQRLLLMVLLLGFSGATVSQAAPGIVAVGPTTPYPILFVTQVPLVQGFGGIATTFGNHQASMGDVGRGGDLWIRYPDGTLKNLTDAAKVGISAGLQGGDNAIAVRDPAVSWDGTKAVFSMVKGAPERQYDYDPPRFFWQLYEITGLGQNETPVITKVPNQPANFNNISPVYGSDGRIIFTTDRPRGGEAHLYPQRDEYELAPIVSGVWSLDPTTGDLRLLNHAPSGDFTPIVDSYGRIVFTQWDHLQRDQEADADANHGTGKDCDSGNTYGTFNYTSEAANASYNLNERTEIFPEPRACRGDLLAGTNLVGHSFNHFFPWTLNQDGTEGEVLGHLGRHELHGYIPASIKDDPNLIEYYGQITRFNKNSIQNMFQIKEDPLQPGRYIGVDAPEFGTHAAGQIISLSAPPNVLADQVAVTYVTRRAQSADANHPGLFREPVPLADGALIAVHTADVNEESGNNTTNSSYEFRLKSLKKDGEGYFVADQLLTGGISKTISYWSPDVLITYAGPLWELNPVEVRPRTPPAQTAQPALAAPEAQMFTQAGVDVAALQTYLQQHNLALAVVRNATNRDDFDLQQPFNLRVPGGTQTIGKPGKIYDVTHLQLFQADQLRGWTGCCGTTPLAGRRVLAQYLHDPAAVAANPVVANAPASSVVVAADGSVAAFVPARRALTWQLTNAAGTGVVRERYWVTYQPGEIRVCTSCHGLSDKDQAGKTAPTNAPQALLALLEHWKSLDHTPDTTPTPTATPSATPTGPTPNATATPTPTPTIVPTSPPTAVQAPQIAGCNIFPADNIWNTPVDTLPVDANSAAYINTIGATRHVHADFGSGLWEGGPIGIPFIDVPGNQPKVVVTFEYDDQSDVGPYPIPANPPIEGGPNSSGDRHILMLDRDNCVLYELYHAFPQEDGTWTAGSGAIYTLSSHVLRPDTWTSADAAGLPILPGLVRYDEVAAGEINHAIRFTVPETRHAYIWPARHQASDLTGAQYPPMGQRFRLKASFNISGYSPAAQVILRAMKKYGIILADNGSSWYISGAPDERWDNDILHELDVVTGQDFEAVDSSSLMLDPNSGQVKSSAPPVVLNEKAYIPLIVRK